MKIKWLLLLFLSITSKILPMERFEHQAIQIVETHEQKHIENLGLPNELWARILEFVYFNPTILDQAKDIFEAIDIIEKDIKKCYESTHPKISLVCKTFACLNSSRKWTHFFKIMRQLYIPYLNERFLEERDDKEGLYPKNNEWNLDSANNKNIAIFIASGIQDNKLLHDQICKLKNIPNTKSLTVLLFYGANINNQDEDGNSPLFYAIALFESITLKALLKNGANPNIKNLEGKSPLSVALEIGSIKKLKLLLTHNADPDARNNWGETALGHFIKNHNAKHTYYERAIILLLRYKAKLNIKNSFNYTALEAAIMRHNSENFNNEIIIQSLLQQGANPNINFSNALHRAIENHYPPKSNNQNIIIMLLENGANPHLTNYRRTAFDLAKIIKLHQFPQLVRKHAQNTLVKICMLHILNNLSLYEDKLHILPIELQHKINSLRSDPITLK